MKKLLAAASVFVLCAFSGCDTVSSFLQDHKQEIVEQIQNATPEIVDALIDFAKEKEAKK